MDGDVFLRAADIYVERNTPHVCWAVGMAEGFQSREFEQSPAVQWFQDTFAAVEAGQATLQTTDMLDAVDGDADQLRDFSLLLLAMAAAVVDCS
jgi:hypothetical protein